MYCLLYSFRLYLMEFGVESDALSLERKRKGQGRVVRTEYACRGTGRKVWGWGSSSWTQAHVLPGAWHLAEFSYTPFFLSILTTTLVLQKCEPCLRDTPWLAPRQEARQGHSRTPGLGWWRPSFQDMVLLCCIQGFMFMITLVLNPRGAVGHMLIGREGCWWRPSGVALPMTLRALTCCCSGLAWLLLLQVVSDPRLFLALSEDCVISLKGHFGSVFCGRICQSVFFVGKEVHLQYTCSVVRHMRCEISSVNTV